MYALRGDYPMAKKKQSKNMPRLLLISLLAVAILILIFLIFARMRAANLSAPTASSEEKSPYSSTNLNLSFSIPEGFTLQELSGEIILKNNINGGEIRITKETANYASLNSYITEIDKTEKTKRQTKRDFLKVNGLDTIMGYYHYPDNQNLDNKSFIFYKDHTLTIISTTSQELYKTLDEVVLSLSFY